MRWLIAAIFLFILPAFFQARCQAGTLRIEHAAKSGELILEGKNARQQLLVTLVDSLDQERDVTHQVQYSATPPGIFSVSSRGIVQALHDGRATLTVKSSTGKKASVPVVVRNSTQLKPIHFGNQIVPIFTKAGCNAGGCHGKSGGQNGFKLSLLGFEPQEDYEFLVREARGRRIFPGAPERSLLLLKGAGILPHGGGERIPANSADYELLHSWIAQGMPAGPTNAAVVVSIEVVPKERILAPSAKQQLLVVAHYSDGSSEDVTASALFEASVKEMGDVDAQGLVSTSNQPGDLAVMVRYQSKATVFRATIPLGAPFQDLPPEKNFIDKLIFAKLKKLGLPPSKVCDDSTFLRRASLDITGRLPTPDQAGEFLSSTAPEKRADLINQLLQSAEYAEYFANKWSALLRNKRGDPAHTRGNFAFHGWIRDSLFENKPYDAFVRDIITASGRISDNPPVAWYRQVSNPTAQAEDTAQLFLGVRLQCAQCHHHPFEKWSQDDYFSFSAFFSQVGRKRIQPGEDAIIHKHGMAKATNKKTKQPVTPAMLGQKSPPMVAEQDPREVLADWMSQPDNHFFARSLVNRYWKHFFNRGIVEPEDDLRETNPPSNPELLEALSKHFIDSGYDLKALIRTICSSTAYQLSSLPNEHNGPDRQNFSRYYVRRLPAEVLFDALNELLQSPSNFNGLPKETRAVALPDNSFNASTYFLALFGRPESSSACECERSQEASLAQSLHLLNAKEIQEKLTKPDGRAAQLAKSSSRSDEEKIRELYLLAFARQPQETELQLALERIQKPAPGSEAPSETSRKQAYEDVIWALLNTKEFLFNH